MIPHQTFTPNRVLEDPRHRHVLKKLKQGCEIRLTTRNASLRSPNQATTPCLPSIVRHLIEAGYLTHKGSDELAEYYALKKGVNLQPKLRKTVAPHPELPQVDPTLLDTEFGPLNDEDYTFLP